MKAEGQISSLLSLAAVTFTITMTVKATSLLWDKVVAPKIIKK